MGVRTACAALGVSRATWYRWRRPRRVAAAQPRARPARALSAAERQALLELLHSERFVDCAPATVYASLLDEGVYLASERTMYRLLATRLNQLWSWDITKLLGPAPWTSYHLYVILDVFSRYVGGWMVAARESAALAERLIGATLHTQEVAPGSLTLHADRGSSMRSQPVALLLADLGVAKTHTRPYTASDNPYSEAHCKTLKYRPGFPRRFASLEDARAFCQAFFRWYNHAHRHAGIGLMTPQTVHYGQSQQVYEARAAVLRAAYAANPERFVRRPPTPPNLPTAAWINPPESEPREAETGQYIRPIGVSQSLTGSM